MSRTRERVMERIRAGLAARQEAATATAPNYVTQGSRAHTDVVALLMERLREYGAKAESTTEAELPTVIRRTLAAADRKRLLAPKGLPTEWRVEGFEWLVDDALGNEEIEAADGVVTAAFCGIADSGTIALHHTVTEGRRVLTLIPDWHLCVLRSGQVVETLPEYFARCVPPPRLATFFSGPSATADIEMTRIKGVHGPRSLHVIVVESSSSPIGVRENHWR